MKSDIPYHPFLYIGDSISKKNLDKLKRKLKYHPLRSNVFLLTTARNGIDQLEIYHSPQLAQPYYRRNPPYVVGIAGTYQEALILLERMVQECWKTRGDCLLKEYLSC